MFQGADPIIQVIRCRSDAGLGSKQGSQMVQELELVVMNIKRFAYPHRLTRTWPRQPDTPRAGSSLITSYFSAGALCASQKPGPIVRIPGIKHSPLQAVGCRCEIRRSFRGPRGDAGSDMSADPSTLSYLWDILEFRPRCPYPSGSSHCSVMKDKRSTTP